MAWASHQLIRRALAARLDDGGVYTLTGAAGATVTAVNLIDTATGASTARFNGAFVYIASGTVRGQQRRVRTNGYDPATGMLTLELTWTPPTAGDEIELTRLFPAVSNVPPEDASYQTLIHRGLGRLAVPDRLPITTTAGTYTYSLETTPWLDRDERLLGALEPDAGGALRRLADWRGVRLRLDAETPYLEVRVPFTGTLTLNVIRPAISWIKVGSVWGESAVGVGLSGDTDEAPVSLDDAVDAALREAYSVLMNRSPGRPNGQWADKWKAQDAVVRALKTYDRTSEMVATPVAPAGVA